MEASLRSLPIVTSASAPLFIGPLFFFTVLIELVLLEEFLGLNFHKFSVHIPHSSQSFDRRCAYVNPAQI
jgi:hypothetical protein